MPHWNAPCRMLCLAARVLVFDVGVRTCASCLQGREQSCTQSVRLAVFRQLSFLPCPQPFFVFGRPTYQVYVHLDQAHTCADIYLRPPMLRALEP